MAKRLLTVSELTAYVKNTLESMVGRVCVAGEISGARTGPTGHLYFTMKDTGAALQCVMFKSALRKVTFAVRDGAQVEAEGAVTVYEQRGQYQLIVEKLTDAGVGDLFRRFEEMKQRLEKEGLFSRERKRPLPPLPMRIGVITSPTGAAVRDIIHVLTRRFPRLRILIYPTLVQGTGAAGQIARAIRRMNELALADVLIVGRGGGSIEDLWAFNEEAVAREIFRSRIPVVSAVGHETDFTIADFVADVRAPTPSAAAEIVTEHHAGFLQSLRDHSASLNRSIRRLLDMKRLRLRALAESRALHSPLEILRRFQQRVDDLAGRLDSSVRETLRRHVQRFEIARTRLDGLNPRAIMGRGYSILRRPSKGDIIRDAGTVCAGEPIEALLWRGSLNLNVARINPEEPYEKDGEQ